MGLGVKYNDLKVILSCNKNQTAMIEFGAAKYEDKINKTKGKIKIRIKNDQKL